MDEAVLIRDATTDDLTAITAIYAQQVRDGTASFELTPPDEAEMMRRCEAVLAAGLPYLVAEADGRIAGYAYASPYRARPAYVHSVENSVYIADWARGRGLGGQLVEAVIERCIAAGKRQMIAIVGDPANNSSVRMHEKIGFRVVGTLEGVGFKHGRWLDTVILQRALGPGASAPPDG